MTIKLFDSAVMQEAEAVAFLAQILESSTEYAIIGTGLDGTILLWNEGARRLYGYEPEAVVGQANSAILHSPEDVASGKARALMETTLREGKWEGRLKRVRKNGEGFTARVVITPRRAANGQPVGYLLISKDISEEIRLTAARDVTERQRCEQTLQEKPVELLSANLAADRFLAGMSHELRTPLNAIMGFTGTLLMRLPGPLTADQDKQLKTIQTSARQLLSLINDLLDLVKLEAGKLELKLEPVVCQAVLQEVAGVWRPLAEAKGLQFSLQAPAAKVILRTDRHALSRIISNLASNAIKFTASGEVRVELVVLREQGQRITQVNVIDSGSGIRAEDQAKLFQAFQQVDPLSARQHEGAGLGLHLSQKLAELLHGQITCQSEYGKGSQFTLTLKEE